jgi:hypothetical protein
MSIHLEEINWKGEKSYLILFKDTYFRSEWKWDEVLLKLKLE